MKTKTWTILWTEYLIKSNNESMPKDLISLAKDLPCRYNTLKYKCLKSHFLPRMQDWRVLMQDPTEASAVPALRHLRVGYQTP